MDLETLLRLIAKCSERLSRGPIPDGSFEKTIKELLEGALRLGLWCSAEAADDKGTLLCVYDVGKRREDSRFDNRNFDRRAVRLLLKTSRFDSSQLDAETAEDIVRRLKDLLLVHWGERDQGTLLPRVADAGMPERVLASVEDLVKEAAYLGVLHLDLDKFKTINTDHGEVVGDRVIRTFSDRLREAFSDQGLIVRKGGEEFSAFLVAADPVVFLSRAEAFRSRMETDPFPAIGRANTCSIGLAIYATADLPAELESVDRILADARGAEERAKHEGRNRIRLPAATPAVAYGGTAPDDAMLDIRLSALACRTSLDGDEATIFRTSFARAVAQIVARDLGEPGLATADVADLVANCAERLDVSPAPLPWSALGSGTPASQAGWPPPVRPLMPTPVWGAIVARALFKATYSRGGPLAPVDSLRFRVSSVEAETTAPHFLWLDVLRPDAPTLVIPLGPMASRSEESAVEVGRPWSQATDALATGLIRVSVGSGGDPTGNEALSPCLLMPIGDAAIREANAIAQLVAGVVEIDDRPVKGGGLPDFWQSNLGRIVRACLRNPNIDCIIAIGDEDGASQTIAWLKLCRREWNERLANLQRRLSIGADHLAAFKGREIEFHLVPSGGPRLLEAVVRRTGAADIRNPLATPAIDLSMEAGRRRLAVPPATASNVLSINDGLRCRSLADAYPQAIQLLRSSDEPPQTEATRRTFREFPCFKLVLTQPVHDDIPDYWLREQRYIEDYVQRNFTSPEGLFGKRLLSPGGRNQAVRGHGIDAAVSAVRNKRPTRRIVLPVDTGDDLDAPLGLSMIQVMPRERGGKWHLDFQWIWRTVEVLVGFPFSAIGSIRWSADFARSVQEELGQTVDADRVELGHLTYVALSFHMFLDVGDKEIARAIVQDASK